ncbi:MAG: molybdenum cofactor biosynthesis protein MoaE [Robiginitomaculum sp.]
MECFSITVSDSPFEPERAHADFRAAALGAGAIVAFTGLVRPDENVSSLTLSHYEGFTQSQIKNISEQARARWELSGLCIIHRVGNMVVGEPIVFVASASAHRRDAFEAADFVMDYLKSEAPFWKSETRGDMAHWVEPSARDIDDKNRWRS